MIKTYKTVVRLFAVAVLVLNSIAQAAVLIDQDFDDTSTFVAGTNLDTTGVGNASTSVGLWQSSNTTPGAEVSTAEYTSAGQSLRSGRISLAYDTGRFVATWDPPLTGGQFEVSASMKRSDASGVQYTASDAELIVGTAHANAIVNMYGYIGDYTIGLRASWDNKLYVRDNFVETDTGFTTDDGWHDYKFVIDLDALTYDVYMDETTLVYDDAVINTGFLRLSGLPDLYVNCFTSGAQYTTGKYYVDDVFVSDDTGPFVCGDPGTVYDEFDFNEDCQVDGSDLAEIVAQWLWCTDPENSDCDQYWK